MLRFQWRPQALFVVLACALSACGGGGGGSGGADAGAGGTPPGGTPATTSLMPPASTPGETLAADASVYRPLVAGGTWRYRGVQTQPNVAQPVVYDTVTQHLPTSVAAQVFETTSNAGNSGSDQTTLVLEAGTITANDHLDLAPGVRVPVPRIELKSPVRAGEQYNLIDRRIEDMGSDVDGDKRNDAADIAAYARVVGFETVALPTLPSIQAIRVDTTLLTRIRTSTSGQWSPVIRIETRAWYAQGLGLVQLQTELPTADLSGVTRNVETLVSFEGSTSGYGAGPASVASVPLTSAIFPGQSVSASSIVAVVPMGDQALLFANRSADGLTVYRMNASGGISGVQHHLGLNNQPRSGFYLRVGNEAVAVNGYGPLVTRFDASGNLLGTVTTLPLSRPGRQGDASVLGAAAQGGNLALLWSRGTADGAATELVMGRFALDGTQVGAQSVVFTGASVDRASFAFSGGRLVAAWSGHASPIAALDVQVAAWAPDSGDLTQTLLLSGASQASYRLAPTVVPLDDGAALMWARDLRTGDPLPESAGLRLDAQFNPVRGGATLNDETVRGMPGARTDSSTPAFQGQGQRMFGLVDRTGPLWPDLPAYPANRTLTLVSWWDAGAGPLSGATVKTLRVGVEASEFNVLRMLVPVGDRLLLLGGDSALTVRTLWLPGSR